MGIDELADLIRRGFAADGEAATEAGGTRFELADYLWDTKYLIVDGGGPGKPPRYTTEFASDLADHIVRHSPARVLAEVAAKRQLLDLTLSTNAAHWVGCEHLNPNGPCTCGRDARVLHVLQLLAQPYQETT